MFLASRVLNYDGTSSSGVLPNWCRFSFKRRAFEVANVSAWSFYEKFLVYQFESLEFLPKTSSVFAFFEASEA